MGILLSNIFDQLCQMKFNSKIIIDFTVMRNSLENVFVQFAKHQVEQPNFNQMNFLNRNQRPQDAVARV